MAIAKKKIETISGVKRWRKSEIGNESGILAAAWRRNQSNQASTASAIMAKYHGENNEKE